MEGENPGAAIHRKSSGALNQFNQIQ